jgi:predicted enzyme related to lactoylglutathione lyase
MPVVYVAVESVDEASRRVVDAGGLLVAERMAIPRHRVDRPVTDTEGNVLGLFERDAQAWVAD